jgi:outer membrane receptor protein involved in Fe transport
MVAWLALACAAAVADVKPESSVKLDIEAQPLADALNLFAQQSGLQVVFFSEVGRGVRAPGLVGNYSAKDALERLLADTTLGYQFIDDKTVAIRARGTTGEVGVGRVESGMDKAQMAQADTASPGVGQSAEEHQQRPFTADAEDKLEEIVVTAQKREERLKDVPMSVTVVSSDDLYKLGATQLRDFATTVPGLTVGSTGTGSNTIALRGVGSFVGSATTAIYVDEVPFGSSTAFAGGGFALDVGLFDIERVEVLRGPQGTLYGASSVGGLLKYVSKQPNATRFGIEAQSGISSTQDGGVSANGVIALNMPIIADKVTTRLTGYYSRDGGYVDNLASAKNDVNRSDTYGGRADLLFPISDALSIRVTGFAQNISRDGEATSDYTLAGTPVEGSLEQRRAFAELFDQRFRLVSGTVKYDLPQATLTSVSSYQTVQSNPDFDITAAYAPLLELLFGNSYSTVGYTQEYSTDKFTQEMRLTSNGTNALEWLIGGFYTEETSKNAQEFVLRDIAGQSAPNDVYSLLWDTHYEEYAAFGDLTWRISNKFDLTGGVRYAHSKQDVGQIGAGSFGSAFPLTSNSASEDVLTYLANAKYHFTDHVTAYLRYATGYRPGGPNFVLYESGTGVPLAPETFEPDRLKSNEIGVKAETSDRRFSVDLAGYYTDWDNIQISAFIGGLSVISNAAGGATVRGGELSLTARPINGFAAVATFAYQDAKLSEADAVLGSLEGERLPNIPRFTAALNGDYELPFGPAQPTVGATIRHVSDRTANFGGDSAYIQPDYTAVDIRAGLMLGRIHPQIYIRNLFDERGQLSGGPSGVFGTRVSLLQPRTIGISVSMQF